MITNEMLQAAMKEAVKSGIFPRRLAPENIPLNKEIMFDILNAALSVRSEEEIGFKDERNQAA